MEPQSSISLGSYPERYYDPERRGRFERPANLTLSISDLLRHMDVSGKTGSGKTTFLKHVASQLIEQGYGLAFLDPHGDAALEFLDLIPKRRINDVVYFDPLDEVRPIGINPFEYVPEKQRHLVVSAFVSVCRTRWEDSWGPRLERILTQTTAALIEHPTGTILGIRRMLHDLRYRQEVLQYVTDPETVAFWTGDEFESYRKKNSGEAFTPVLNKIGEFVASPNLRNIIGQTKNTIDFRAIMDDGLIFIANLSEGQIGETECSLLGSFISAKFARAAYSRTDIKKHQRRPFVLILDEFPKFVDAKFPVYMSELRKFHFALIFAHQYFAQLDEKIINGIKGNVENFVTFQQGADDAKVFEEVFGYHVEPREFIELFTNEAWAKIQTGEGDDLIRWKKQITTPQWFDVPSYANAEEIIKQSRMKFGAPYDLVVKRVAQRLTAEI